MLYFAFREAVSSIMIGYHRDAGHRTRSRSMPWSCRPCRYS